jgi:protein subunit release factor A
MARRLTDFELTARQASGVAETVDLLAEELRRVSFLLVCDNATDLGDAFLVVTRLKGEGAALEGMSRIAQMYVGLAKRRRLETVVVSDRRGGDPFEDSFVLLTGGPGAYGLLAGEAGHHVFSRRRDPKTGRKPVEDREVLKVEVLPVPAEGPRDVDVTMEVRKAGDVRGRFDVRPAREIALRHAPSALTVTAWAPDGDEAAGLLPLYLRARIDGLADVEAPRVVRRYVLGPSPLVKDRRSGRQSGRLDRVLAGDLDLFLTPRG